MQNANIIIKLMLNNLSKLAVAIMFVSTVTKNYYFLEISFFSFLLLIYDSIKSGSIRDRCLIIRYRDEEPNDYWLYVYLYVALAFLTSIAMILKWIRGGF